MSNDRKNVMDSIANFQLNDDRSDNVLGSLSQSQTAEAPQTKEAAPEPTQSKFVVNRKVILSVFAVALLIAISVVVNVDLISLEGSKSDSPSLIQADEVDLTPQNGAVGVSTKNSDLHSLKSDIAMMQITMNTVLERLDSVASAAKLNDFKQRQVDELVQSLTAGNDEKENYFGQQLEKLTLWQKQYQQQQLTYLEQQKRQLANLEVDVEKLNKDAINHNYANKFTYWQADIDTIKEQQIQINSLLLELQKEYIKLNQYQQQAKVDGFPVKDGNN